MMLKIMLCVAARNCEESELDRFLSSEKADIYVFPEGFLKNETVPIAKKASLEHDCMLICGYKQSASFGASYQKALVIDRGEIVDEYSKCILTPNEKEKGTLPGTEIRCVNTRFGKIGIPICYEIHFPEVSRIMALENPIMLVNIIGTGMYHQKQYDQWTALARARAIENEIIVMGCCHFVDQIPLAYAYSADGYSIANVKNSSAPLVITVDTEQSFKREINYVADRRPEFFGKISR